MKRTLTAATSAALVALAVAACEPSAPPNASSSASVPAEAIPAGETLGGLVREALTDIVHDGDAFSRARRLGTLLPTLGPEAVPVVTEMLADRSLDLGATELILLVRYWTNHQPEDAAKWALKQSPTDYRPALAIAALSTWAENDSQAAVKFGWPWAGTLGFDRIVPYALVSGWFAAGDPPELIRWIHDLPPGIVRQRALADYVRTMIQNRGSEATKRWAESLPDDDSTFKTAAFRKVVTALSQIDVQAGIRWCETQCDGPYGDNMRSLIARTWVDDDGPAALAWLSTLNEGYERDNAVRVTFAKWARTNRKAAVEWMASQTTGEPEPWLRPIYPVYAKLLAPEAPTEAIAWAERIENESEREHILVQVARVWRHLDESAAEAWLEQSSLSDAAREQVRAPVEE